MIDVKYQKCFFGDKGITSTSANYLANIAKEAIQESQKFLDSISFYSTDVSYIGSTSKSRIKKSTSKADFASIKDRIKEMCEYNTFIAWVREAIKEKERMLDLVKCVDFDEYLSIFGIKLERPTRKVDYDTDDAMRELSVGQRFLYLNAEACSATYGQIIHPNRAISTARTMLNNLVRNPIEVRGEGRDALIYTHNFDFSTEEVDQLFFELQDVYRTHEKFLNNQKYNIKLDVLKNNNSRLVEYKDEYAKYEAKREELYTDYKHWKENQIAEISTLKIVIPDKLKGMFEKLNQMGKAE